MSVNGTGFHNAKDLQISWSDLGIQRLELNEAIGIKNRLNLHFQRALRDQVGFA